MGIKLREVRRNPGDCLYCAVMCSEVCPGERDALLRMFWSKRCFVLVYDVNHSVGHAQETDASIFKV